MTASCKNSVANKSSRNPDKRSLYYLQGELLGYGFLVCLASGAGGVGAVLLIIHKRAPAVLEHHF